MANVTNKPFDKSALTGLSASDYCKCCLVDLNKPGQPKKKGNCHLPVRTTPGGPIYTNALRNAAARLPLTQIPPAERRKAAQKMARLMKQAGITPGKATLRIAGLR